jgi:hypothetical protein
MHGGQDWWLQIAAALGQVEYALLVLTPAALASDVVRKEWRHARQQGVCVLPVKGAPGLDFEALPRWMRDVHWYDTEREWPKLLEHVQQSPESRRVPFMVDDLPSEFVARTREHEQLLALLVDGEHDDPVPATVGVCGAGGFGKTTTVKALCHDQRIREAFDDGIVWVTLGKRPGDLADRVTDLIETLTGARPGFSGLDAAVPRLAEALADRDLLMVLDDAWNHAHLTPFLVGGARCARVITTRTLDALPPGAVAIDLDAMHPEEGAALVASGLPAATSSSLAGLATRLGQWPLLLRLANGALRARVARGQGLPDALAFVNTALDRRGLTALDAHDAEARHQAVSRTLAVSLELLTEEERGRYSELAVFPEGVSVPLDVVARLWSRTGNLAAFDTQDLCDRLARLSLLHLDLARGSVRLHDVLRQYLREQGGARTAAAHSALVEAYAEAAQGQWARGPNDGYFFEYLACHLAAAGCRDELARLLTASPDWMTAQFAATRGDASYRRDLNRAMDIFPDPRSGTEFVAFTELRTALEVARQRAGVHTDSDLSTLVWLDREAEALGWARLRDDLPDRVRGLAAIAEAMHERARDAAPVISEGRQAAQAITDREARSGAFAALAAALTKAGRLVDAWSLTRGIDSLDGRASALARLGHAAARLGDESIGAIFDEALEACRAIDGKDRQAATLAEIARFMIDAGEFTKAIDCARGLPPRAFTKGVRAPATMATLCSLTEHPLCR